MPASKKGNRSVGLRQQSLTSYFPTRQDLLDSRFTDGFADLQRGFDQLHGTILSREGLPRPIPLDVPRNDPGIGAAGSALRASLQCADSGGPSSRGARYSQVSELRVIRIWSFRL